MSVDQLAVCEHCGGRGVIEKRGCPADCHTLRHRGHAPSCPRIYHVPCGRCHGDSLGTELT
jgi:hypothetical protein